MSWRTHITWRTSSLPPLLLNKCSRRLITCGIHRSTTVRGYPNDDKNQSINQPGRFVRRKFLHTPGPDREQVTHLHLSAKTPAANSLRRLSQRGSSKETRSINYTPIPLPPTFPYNTNQPQLEIRLVGPLGTGARSVLSRGGGVAHFSCSRA